MPYFKSMLILWLTLLVSLPAAAQTWSVSSIPEDIARGAPAVVRFSETVFDYVSPTLTRERNTLVVTVLTHEGEDLAVFQEYTDNFRSFSGFSGEIYDRVGKQLRKIKKSELAYSDYSQNHLAIDMRTHYCTASLPNPPYTVKYEWEITTKNGVWAFPAFSPRPALYAGVEKAVYRLEIPVGTDFHTRAYNTDITPRKESAGNKDIYVWSVENLAPVIREPFMKPSYQIRPTVFFSPDYFIYDGVAGSMKDWQSYAEWQWELLDRSSEMPDGLKAQVAELTRDAADDMEKIRILYDYLGRTTRYVSIQIGIGGFQPMSIAEVYKNKYGDCKALTNYMRIMLRECGIESHYVEIGMGRRSIPRDFANPAMSNHAILMVPAGVDTLWVECTNPELPLGYRHNSIVGQNALVYKNGTAEVITVPRYEDHRNLSERRADVVMRADGSATAHVATVERMNRFEDCWSFGRKNAVERLNTLRGQVNMPLAVISNPSYREIKESEPAIEIEYDLESGQFGSRTGDRLFVNVMSFRKPMSIRFGRTRRNDICVQEGYCDRDITRITLPAEELQIEVRPKDVALESKYGSYSIQTLISEGVIEIERNLLLRTGTYDKEEFAGFKEFIETVSGYDSGKLVLKSGKN